MFFLTPGWDDALFRLLNSGLRSGLLDVAAPILSEGPLLWLASGIFLAIVWRRRRAAPILLAVALLGSASFADHSASLFKDAVGRIRPLNALPQVHYREDGEWRKRPADFQPTTERGSSFPSGHAANSCAVAVALLLFWRRSVSIDAIDAKDAKDAQVAQDAQAAAEASPEARPTPLRWLALLLPLTVGWSRIYLGKHYPLDILGGWALGAICAALLWAATLAFLDRRDSRRG